MPANAEVTPTTYRLRMQNGTERVLTMPRNWKITFGPNVPGAGRNRDPYASRGPQGWCFRVYDTQKLLKLVIPDVVEFWEESTFTLEVLERDEATEIILQRVNMNRRRPVQSTLNAWIPNGVGMAQGMMSESVPPPPPSFAEEVAPYPDQAIAEAIDRLRRNSNEGEGRG